jgi:prolipoprotein diacylglyceryl transferase
VAVFLAGWMTQREFRRRGLDPEQVYTIAAWCVPGGIIGARIYHVVTDWDRFSDDLASIPALWEGGLGMFGVIVGGATGAYIAARRTGIPFGTVFDSIAPGLIAAQAIGRFGNWFNQELFGRPTDLPWALEIDPGRRPARFAAEETFHPTFLYESLWNVLVCCVLLVIARRAWRRLRPGVIFACYLVGYSLGRFPIEGSASTRRTSGSGCASTSTCSPSCSWPPSPTSPGRCGVLPSSRRTRHRGGGGRRLAGPASPPRPSGGAGLDLAGDEQAQGGAAAGDASQVTVPPRAAARSQIPAVPGRGRRRPRCAACRSRCRPRSPRGRPRHAPPRR